MEGGVQTRKWISKASAGTILLLMCMFIPTLTLTQLSLSVKCEENEYPNKNGICCNKCSAGFKLVEECHNLNERTNCTRCPESQYNDEINYSRTCRTCRTCRKSRHEIEESPCETKYNTICRCEDGFYKFRIDSETYDCRKCSRCGTDEKEKEKCTTEKNTKCVCTENYYRVNHRCEPCKNCSSECKHMCPSPNTQNIKAPETWEKHLLKIIVGFVAVVLVVSGVLVAITYIATKRSTKNKLLKSTSETSEDSLDSCESGLIYKEQHSNNSVEAAPCPVEDQEPSNLLDFPLLEIKIPDLIYTVLDLVPVLKVKQLMRSLGVRDSEIEHAELDYKSSREAHYQMLRVWAERGSRAGGRKCGDLLHRPLLQELLEKLREMDLGRAAEELETKYGIQ